MLLIVFPYRPSNTWILLFYTMNFIFTSQQDETIER